MPMDPPFVPVYNLYNIDGITYHIDPIKIEKIIQNKDNVTILFKTYDSEIVIKTQDPCALYIRLCTRFNVVS